MRFRAKRPEFDHHDHEYVIPIRLAEDTVHGLLGGWVPFGVGWAHLRPRSDGSYDLFLRTSEIREDLNIVSLAAVQEALMAALDLAIKVREEGNLVSEETSTAAAEVTRLVQGSAQ